MAHWVHSSVDGFFHEHQQKMDVYQKSLALHSALRGKIKIDPKIEIHTSEDLALVYSPGVAEPCREIYKSPEAAYEYTMKGNMVAVISDGTAVLGLGNIGPLAALPVMEGKCMLFKRFAGVDAFPIVLDTQDTDQIVQTIRNIAPTFGGINLEDISAPRSFEVEARLQDLGIPVFHDDQHGTAIVVLAALINSCKILGKKLEDLKIVINGAGAAGIAIARLLRCVSIDPTICIPVREVIMADSRGIIHRKRDDINDAKREILRYSNPNDLQGTVRDALEGADVFIGVSVGNLLKTGDIRRMNPDSIVLALANPTPEIMPAEALAGGAAIVGTGRSDLPNQVNNVLAFPGIFRGALDARAKTITAGMKIAAAYAIAESVDNISRDQVIPSSLNNKVAYNVAQAVKKAYLEDPFH